MQRISTSSLCVYLSPTRAAFYLRIFLAILTVVLWGVPSRLPHVNASSNVNWRVGTSADFPPMEYLDGGQIVGHGITLMNAVADHLGAQLTYSNIPFDQLFSSLENDMVDVVISTVTVTTERETIVDFTLPYVVFDENEQIAIVVKNGNDTLRQQINEALLQIRADGTLLSIVQAIQADFASQQPQMPTWPELSADTPVSLDFGQGQVSVTAPASAVTIPTVLGFNTIEPLSSPHGFFFAGQSFQLDSYQNGAFTGGLTFQAPVEITVRYEDSGLSENEERSLMLWVWSESSSQWEDAGTTCSPTSVYERNLTENWLSVNICHLSRFGLFGRDLVFLPAIQH